MSDYYLPASSGEKEMGYMNQEGHVFLQASIFQPYLHIQNIIKRKYLTVFSTALLDFPGGSVVKNPLANAGQLSLIPELGRSPREGNGNPFQYSPWEIPWTEEPDRLQSIGHRVTCNLATNTTQQQLQRNNL